MARSLNIDELCRDKKYIELCKELKEVGFRTGSDQYFETFLDEEGEEETYLTKHSFYRNNKKDDKFEAARLEDINYWLSEKKYLYVTVDVIDYGYRFVAVIWKTKENKKSLDVQYKELRELDECFFSPEEAYISAFRWIVDNLDKLKLKETEDEG